MEIVIFYFYVNKNNVHRKYLKNSHSIKTQSTIFLIILCYIIVHYFRLKVINMK